MWAEGEVELLTCPSGHDSVLNRQTQLVLTGHACLVSVILWSTRRQSMSVLLSPAIPPGKKKKSHVALVSEFSLVAGNDT